MHRSVRFTLFAILFWCQILYGQEVSSVPLQVTLTPLRTNYKASEKWTYEIRIENISSDTVIIPKSIDSQYTPRMIDPEGRIVPWEYAVLATGYFDEGNTIMLPPGYFYGKTCSWSGLEEAAEYRFHVIYVAGVNLGDALSRYWQGTIESNSVKITVE